MCKKLGGDFIPANDEAQFEIYLQTPEGTSLDATTLIGERIARQVRDIPEVDSTLVTVAGGDQRQSNVGSIYVHLSDPDNRKRSQNDVMQQVRTKILPNVPTGWRVAAQPVNDFSLGGQNAMVSYVISGPDLDKLTLYSDQLLAKMKTIPKFTDADSTLRSGKPEVHVEIDRARAADLGVSVENIEQAINTLVAGQTASTFNTGDDQYDVVVRAQQSSRGTVEELAKMTVPSNKKGSVGLDEVVGLAGAVIGGAGAEDDPHGPAQHTHGR